MADLLGLQSDIKRDADGYADDFRLQYRHYQAVLSVFFLHPAQKHEGILELVHFIAQVRISAHDEVTLLSFCRYRTTTTLEFSLAVRPLSASESRITLMVVYAGVLMLSERDERLCTRPYKAPGHPLCCAGSCIASRAGEGSDPSQEQGTGPLSSSFHVSVMNVSIAEESPCCEHLPSLARCLLRAVRHAACNNRAAPLILPALQMPGQGPEADAVPAYSGR